MMQEQDKLDAEETDRLSEAPAEEPELDRFSSLMFGPGRGRRQREHIHRQDGENYQQQSGVDYVELMGHIDALYESVQGLKPLFQKVYPVIEQLWKKR